MAIVHKRSAEEEVKLVMNEKMHIQKVTLIAIVAMLLMTGCKRIDTSFDVHADLGSIAMNSLIGASGYISGEMPRRAEFIVIEEDNFGRELFIYYEGGDKYNLFISQKSDGEYVYFYPDYNFIVTLYSKSTGTIGMEVGIDETIFPSEEIEKLKKRNDWNKEIDVNKCVEVEIVREKGEGPIEYEVIESIYYELLKEDGAHAKYDSYFLTTDDYGRSIYAFYGYRKKGDYEEHAEYEKYKGYEMYYMIVVLQPDGSYDEDKGVMKLMYEEYEYQDKLKEFKELNNWNKPIGG